MPNSFPPTTETSAGKPTLAGGARLETSTSNRPNEAGFFVPHPAFDEYERIHKRFVGPKTADKLLHIHEELAGGPPHIDHLAAAGWAAAEAALVATDRPADARLGYLDQAAESWDRAIAYQQERNERHGLAEDYQHANMNRLQLSRIFIPLMEGMIEGDVTKQIRMQVYDDLLFLAAQNAVGLIDAAQNQRETGQYIGLAHEINAMLAVNRLQSPTLIAIPALARADSGRFHPRQTHDIELLHLNWGTITGVTTIESKARPKEKHYKRYEAAIVGGRIHLFTKTGTSPVDTVQLFLKEQEGTLLGDEYDELEQMTDTIVHLARHQLSGAIGVSTHCRDIARCSEVPRHRSGSIPRGLGGLAIAS